MKDGGFHLEAPWKRLDHGAVIPAKAGTQGPPSSYSATLGPAFAGATVEFLLEEGSLLEIEAQAEFGPIHRSELAGPGQCNVRRFHVTAAKTDVGRVDVRHLDLAHDIAIRSNDRDVPGNQCRNREHGGLYYALPDGSKIVELVHPMLSPNGVGLCPDEKTVYVADTETSRLFAFDIVEPGVLRKEPFPAPYTGRLVCGLPGFQRFDSLAVEASGNIAVATLITGHITVIAPDGRVVRQVKLPDVYPTNICFGGSDMTTAYITLSANGQLAAMDWPEPGLRLNFSG